MRASGLLPVSERRPAFSMFAAWLVFENRSSALCIILSYVVCGIYICCRRYVSKVDIRVVNHGQSCCNRRRALYPSNADTKQEIADVCVCAKSKTP